MSSCSCFSDVGEVRGIQGVLSQSEDLDIQINFLPFKKLQYGLVASSSSNRSKYISSIAFMKPNSQCTLSIANLPINVSKSQKAHTGHTSMIVLLAISMT